MTNLNHKTIPEALAYVERLSMQIDGMTATSPTDAGHMFLHQTGGRTIEVKAGEPRSDWIHWGRRSCEERMEQVTIRAPRSKRLHGYAVDQARTFKVRKDGTLNGAGILNALRQLVHDMNSVDRFDKDEEKSQSDRNDLRAKNRAKLEAAGLEFRSCNTVGLAFSDISVKVEVTGDGVNIALPGLSPEAALAILRNLGIVAKVEA